jgi:hypothetical protein
MNGHATETGVRGLRYTVGMIESVRRGLLVLVALVGGCARPATTAPGEPPPRPALPEQTASSEAVPVDLAAALIGLEEKLLRQDFALRFEIEAEGGVTSRFVGELRAQGDALSLGARGSFAGQAIELSLEADSGRLEGSNGTGKLDLPRPPALEEALVIGLTRMGLLHNLAVLTRVRPPDGSDGGVREWVRVEDVVSGPSVGPPRPFDPALDGRIEAMSFRVLVSDDHVADATLWWDPTNELPVERHQIVRFPGGEMLVRESYQVEWLGPAPRGS